MRTFSFLGKIGLRKIRTLTLLFLVQSFILNLKLGFRQILSSADLFLFYQTDSRDSRTFNDFTLLNGWICLHGVLD